MTAELSELQLAILELLPEVGSKRGKYLPDGRTAKQLAADLDDEFVSSLNVGRVLVELDKGGLVTQIRGHHGMIWQRTTAGREAVVGQ